VGFKLILLSVRAAQHRRFNTSAASPVSSRRHKFLVEDMVKFSDHKVTPMQARVLVFASHAHSQWQREKLILALKYRIIILGVIFQYFHNVASNVAYFLHIPREPLFDVGFAIFPSLSYKAQIGSDVLFCLLLFSTICFGFSPFMFPSRRVYATQMLARFVAVCVLAQCLRVITFFVTTLPAPNYHCRPDSPVYNPPKTVWDVFLRQDGFHGCGDLVFSSHSMFAVLCALTVQKYSSSIIMKVVWWVVVFALGLLVVAARKHYSLDVIIAWYTLPLIWIAYEFHFPDKLPKEFEFEDSIDPEDYHYLQEDSEMRIQVHADLETDTMCI